MKRFEAIEGVLFDLDGVLYVGDDLIDGAVEAIRYVIEKKIPHRFVTNTTTKSRKDLAFKLQKMGFVIQEDEILSSPAAARIYLKKQQFQSCYLVVSDAIKSEFSDFPISETSPDVVVIGDIGNAWSYDLMNRLFGMLINGSKLVALHKGKYWETSKGLQVDIGAFIAGLEYATGVKAMIMGKPSAAFFEAAVADLGVAKEKVMMIGDDIDSDVGGAQACGLQGVLVQTGKYRQAYAEASSITPDGILKSIAELSSIV